MSTSPNEKKQNRGERLALCPNTKVLNDIVMCKVFSQLSPRWKEATSEGEYFNLEYVYSKGSNLNHSNVTVLAFPLMHMRAQQLTLPGITRLSMPIKSFLSSCSFWKFSILIIVPWSCATISVISAKAANEGNRHKTGSINGRQRFLSPSPSSSALQGNILQ